MTAVATYTAPGHLPVRAGEILSGGAIGLAVRLLDRVVPERETRVAEPAVDSIWAFRVVRGRLVAGGYRRGALAFAPDAARALLDLQERDAVEARAVLSGAIAAAAGEIRRSGSLFVLGDTLVVGHRTADGPALLITHLS